MTTPLIGLGGKLTAGKDVVADYLVEKHGYVKLGMSDALHDAMMVLNPIVYVNHTYDEEFTYVEAIQEYGYVKTKELFPEARRLLQALGTEVGRKMFGENVWVDIMTRKIQERRDAGLSVAVTGIRFPNELEMIHDLGGWSVWVHRPGLESTDTHDSENSVRMEDFQVIVNNDSTIEVLRDRAKGLALDVAVW